MRNQLKSIRRHSSDALHLARLSYDEMNLLIAINLTAAATSLYVIYQLLHRLFSPLRSVRGPFLARFTDAWYAWRLWLGRFERDNQQLHETYGLFINNVSVPSV